MRNLVAYTYAPFYVPFGQWQLAGELGTAFFGTLIGYFAYKIAYEVTTQRNAVLAAVIVVFWPSIVYRSVVIQREVIVTVAMLVMVWIALRWTEQIRLRDVTILALVAAVVFMTRPENLPIIAITLGTALALKYRRSPRYIAAVGLLSVPVLAYFALNFGELTGVGTAISPEVIDSYAHGRDHGGSAYLVDLHYNSWLDILLYLPLKVVYYLFSPMPWDVNSLADLLAGVSGWGLVIATPLAVTGFLLLRNQPEKRIVMATYALSGIAAYAIIEMNAGAAFRRRIQFVPIILIFAAIGFSHLFDRSQFTVADVKSLPRSLIRRIQKAV